MLQNKWNISSSVLQKLQELAAGKKLPQAFYNVKSSYFEVTVDTLFGRYRRTTESLVVRPGGQGPSQVLWHRQRLPTNISAPTTTPNGNSPPAAGEKI